MRQPKNKRLFGVVNKRNGEPLREKGEPKYFDQKGLAKNARDDAMEETGEAYIVVKGPDHWRFDNHV